MCRVGVIVLALIAGVFGFRSIWTADAINWTDGQTSVSLVSSRGRLNFVHTYAYFTPAVEPRWLVASWSRAEARPFWESSKLSHRRTWGGFECSEDMWDLMPRRRGGCCLDKWDYPATRLIAIPSWAIGSVLLLPLVPGLLRARRRRGRLRRQLCPDCGYDMRFLLGRCPECGCAQTWASDFGCVL